MSGHFTKYYVVRTTIRGQEALANEDAGAYEPIYLSSPVDAYIATLATLAAHAGEPPHEKQCGCFGCVEGRRELLDNREWIAQAKNRFPELVGMKRTAGEPQAGEARQFPIMEQGTFSAFSIPWSMIESHNEQALKNHSQSLETLASRGGLSPTEALCVLDNRPFAAMDLDMAVRHLRERVLNLGPQSNRQHAGEGKAKTEAEENLLNACLSKPAFYNNGEEFYEFCKAVAAERAPLVGRERPS